jgi:hypothetical protein
VSRALLSLLTAAACLIGGGVARAATPPIKHVFVIVLENKDYGETFGAQSHAPYLAKTLVGRGQLLTQYHGIGHLSLDNYIAMVSGQPPNPYTQADAPLYANFVGTGPNADGVWVGQGSVYPSGVKTIADQLEAKGLTWKGYMEDMGTPCRHPAVGAPDQTQNARADDQYAARHNPFMYFHSIIDRPACAKNVVDLKALQGDLASTATTPNYTFVTPDLCSDAHDEPCADGRPGGLVSANAFLQTWVPRITGSPAYRKDGMLIVTFDEAGSDGSDCCNEPTGPNTPNNAGPNPGNGGGRTGTVLLSRYVRPGATNNTPYNHYSLLRSIEDLFGLAHLGYAGRPDLKPFGADVYNGRPAKPKPRRRARKPRIRIRGLPRHCVRHPFRIRIRVTRAPRFRTARVFRDGHRIARQHRRRFRERIGVRHRIHGRHHLVVRVTQRRGPRGYRSAHFRVCKRR